MSTLTWRGMEPPKQEILDKAYKLAKDSCPKWFYDEVEEDLDNLASLLKSSVLRRFLGFLPCSKIIS